MPDENFWDNDPVSTPAAPTVPTVGTAPSGGNFWDNDPVVPKAASAPTGIYAPIKNYTTLKYLGGNGRGTSYAPLLQDIHKAAEGLGLTLGISSAYRPGAVTTSGHTSRHASQHAVDISTINGFPVTDPQGKALGDMLAARLKSMGFETGEHGTNRGLLWQTMVGGNHFNHLHVSYPSSATIPAGAMGMIPGVAGALTAPAKKPVPIPAQALQMVPGIAGALATPAKKTPVSAPQASGYNPVLGIPTPPPASQFVKSIKPSTYPGPLQEALENAAAEAGLTPEQYRQGVKKYGIAAVEKGAAGRQAQAQYQQQISGGIEAIPGLIDRPFTSALAGVPIEQAPSNLLSALSERSQPGSAQALEEMPGFLPGVAKTLSSFVTPSNAALMKLLGPVNKGATALGEKIAGMGAEAGRTRAQEIALKMAGKAIQQGPLAPFAVESVKGAIQQARAGDPWGAVGSLAAFFGPMAIHDYVAAVAKDNPKLITPAQARTFYQDAFSTAKEGPKSVKRPSPVDVTQKATGQMTEADVEAALQKSTPPTFRNAEQYNMPTPAETPSAPAAQEPPATPLPATETGATPPNVSQPVTPVETPTGAKGQANAVQKPEAGSVLQRQPEEVGGAGASRGGVEQGVQGQETPGAGQAQTPQAVDPRTATIEDVESGRVPGLQLNRNKSAHILASRRQGYTEVSPAFFDLPPFEREVLLGHETGHDVAAKLLSKGLEKVAELEPFRIDNGPLNINSRYDNPAGFSQLPEEVIADVYSHTLRGGKSFWEEPGKYHDLYDLVQRTAKELGLPYWDDATQAVITPELPIKTGASSTEGAKAGAEVATKLPINTPQEVAPTPPDTGQRYHGTSQPIELGSVFDRYQSQNLYGPGLYTTDNEAIAGKYTKKGQGTAPTVYHVEWTGKKPPHLLDLEKPLPPELHELFEGNNVIAEPLDFSKPGKNIYQQLKENWATEGLTREDVEERMHDLVLELQRQGYDGYSHIGGRKAESVKHNVTVYFGDPQYGVPPVKLTQRPSTATENVPAPEKVSEPVPATETPSEGEWASPEDQAANADLWQTVKKGDLLTEPGSSQRLRVQAKSATRIKVVDEAKAGAPSFTISRNEFLQDYNLNVRAENETAPTPAPATEATDLPHGPEATSARKATMARDRADLDLPELPEAERKGWQTTLQNAQDRGLPETATAKARAILEKPTALDDEWTAAMVLRAQEIKNENADLLKQAAETTDPETLDLLRQRMTDNGAEFDTLTRALKASGTEKGRSLASQKLTIDRDYDLTSVLSRARLADPNRPLDPKTAATLEKQAKDLERVTSELETAQKKAADLQAKITELESKGAGKQAIDQMKREAASEVRSRKIQDIRQQRADIQRTIARKLGRSSAITPGGIPVDIIPDIAKLAKSYVSEGVIRLEDLVDKVHGDLSPLIDNLTKRDVRDAISGYGKTSHPDPTEPGKTLRELKAQMRLVSALEDAQNKERPLKSGFQREAQSDKVRDLTKQVHAAMKEAGIDTTSRTPEQQMASALDAVKTRLKNQIADLTKRIETGEKLPAENRGVTYDKEATALKAERDRLQGVYNQLHSGDVTQAKIDLAIKATQRSLVDLRNRIASGNIEPQRATSALWSKELGQLKLEQQKLTEQLADLRKAAKPPVDPLKGYKTRLQKEINALQDKINRQDFTKPTKRAPTALDKQAEELRGQRDLLRKQIDAEIAKREPKGFLDKFVAWHREAILSGASVFAKLGGASAWAMPVETLADAMGYAAGKATGLGKIAENEGQFSLHSQGTKLRAFASREAVKNAVDSVMKGMNAIDAEAGMTPHNELGGYMGRFHGAAKSFLQTAEYRKSVEVRTAKAARQGLDINAPEVQAQIGMAAAVDAQNIKLQGTNAFADWINQSIGAGRNSKSGLVRGGAAFARTIVPITRIPANYIGRAIQMTGEGLAEGAIRHGAAALESRRSGKPIPPEVADKILQAYKYGGVGLAAAYIGLTQPAAFKSAGLYAPKAVGNKGTDNKPMEPGSLQILGHTVPRLLAHSPFVEAVQFWATIRRGWDQHNLSKGAFQAFAGFATEAPGVESTARATRALEGEKPFQHFAGEYSRSLTEPQIVQQGAKYLDKDRQGKPVNREPQNYLQEFMVGLPHLREQVPVKGSVPRKTVPRVPKAAPSLNRSPF